MPVYGQGDMDEWECFLMCPKCGQFAAQSRRVYLLHPKFTGQRHKWGRGTFQNLSRISFPSYLDTVLRLDNEPRNFSGNEWFLGAEMVAFRYAGQRIRVQFARLRVSTRDAPSHANFKIFLRVFRRRATAEDIVIGIPRRCQPSRDTGRRRRHYFASRW